MKRKQPKIIVLSVLLTLLFSCISPVLANSSQDAYNTYPIRTTLYGDVKGYIDTEHNTEIYKGIPYAKSERWSAPEDPDSWEGLLDATEYGNFAMQLSRNEVIGSEDCLNLDIYRPDNDEENLPVLVFIHGGNNQTGYSSEITGEAIANDLNCVYISINYRLGALGFNPLPSLKTGTDEENSGNYALLDMAKALDWIKENVNNFGGATNNVTVSGFSAGGRDVMAMLISPLFKGKFEKAISFSGGMTIADEKESAKVFAKAIAPLVVEDGIKSSEEEAYDWLLTADGEVEKYLYSVSGERLSKLMGNASIRMSVFPHLYNDGVVLPEEGFDSTEYNDVPLLMLTGSSEFSMFAMGSSVFEDENLQESTKYAFANKYGGALYGLFNVKDSAEKMYEDYSSDIYCVEINYGDNADIVGSDMALYGAYHGVFVPLINSNASTSFQAFSQKGAQELGKQFRSYMTNFIRSGDPNGDSLTTWDKWTNTNLGNLILDATAENAIIKMDSKTLTYDDVLKQMDDDTTLSESDKMLVISQVLDGRWFSGKLDDYYNNKTLWVVDKRQLNTYISNAQSLDSSDYTEESWDVLQNALINAIAINNNDTVTQSKVDEAAQVLIEAIEGLVMATVSDPSSEDLVNSSKDVDTVLLSEKSTNVKTGDYAPVFIFVVFGCSALSILLIKRKNK